MAKALGHISVVACRLPHASIRPSSSSSHLATRLFTAFFRLLTSAAFCRLLPPSIPLFCYTPPADEDTIHPSSQPASEADPTDKHCRMSIEERLGASCPGKGSFYVCHNKPTRFLGCCTIDPCATRDGGCPAKNLEPASFSASAYDKIPSQSCLSFENGTDWYTCAAATPPFVGCCAINACLTSTGCDADSVRPARLSDTPANAAAFLAGSPSDAPSSTSLVSATQTSEAAKPAAAAAAEGGLSKGAVAGIAIASVACTLLLCALFLFISFRRRRRTRKTSEGRAHDAKGGGDDGSNGAVGCVSDSPCRDVAQPSPLSRVDLSSPGTPSYANYQQNAPPGLASCQGTPAVISACPVVAELPAIESHRPHEPWVKGMESRR
ncbi:hypothetical protein RJ55_04066 [Drechmeria coniospora]|nr:hypothetical protein RJ55_04066 [Drechmeria coniospora]